MTDLKLEELMRSLFDAKITKVYSYDKSTYRTFAIEEQGRTIIEQIIRSFLLDNRNEQLGILQAKVFMYEEIIAKSTFAPMLPKEEDKQTEITPPYKREMLFTQTQIEHLASKVFHLTGEGEVMSLFNDLLCEPCSNSVSQS